MEELEIHFSKIASLIGDRARAVMLWNLLDGRAYTATELSLCADISAQAASNHLARLTDANILTISKQGRHRYYTFSSPEAAQVIESIASLLPSENIQKKITKPAPTGVTYARTCYDHLAGKAGVAITDALIHNGFIKTFDKTFDLSASGEDWFQSIGIDINKVKLQKRSFAHQCLDWSERRYHLAGSLAASFLQVMLKNDWLRKIKNSREILITPKGKMELSGRLNLDI